MADNEEGGFWGRIRGNAEWDAVKFGLRWGRPLIYAAFGLLYDKVRHFDRDWLLIGGLFFLGALTSIVGYLVNRRGLPMVVQLPNDEVKLKESRHPNGMSDEQWKIHCQSVAIQNELIELGRSVEGLFTPTQIQAFRVAREIRDFVNSSLPRPDVSWENLDPVNGVAKRIGERWKLVEPWLLKLRHRYARELAPKLKQTMHLLGEEGFNVSALEPYVNEITNEADAWSAAQVLDHLAYTASYKPWVLDTQWRDTVRRYEAMHSDQYRAALDIPGFGQAVEEAISSRSRETGR